MKIKFDYNENNESDLFVKKSKTNNYKRGAKKIIDDNKGKYLARKISLILLVILLIAFIIFIILLNISEKEKIYPDYDYVDSKDEIKENVSENVNMSIIYYNAISRVENLKIGKVYIEKCLTDNMTKKFEKVDNPIISVIIPVFNCEKTIKYAISSIQNQNVTDIEIILINDFSKDNSLNIIQEIQNFDKRIVIINNEKNMGSLYTRSIGILMAKGIYIFALDNDDMFFQEDIFDTTYKVAIKGKFDIVGFRAVNVGSYKDPIYKMFDSYFSFKKNNLIVYQPKLGMYPVTYKGQYAANDYTIWGKCIRTEIYKKAVNSLGKERYSMFLSWCEDTSIVFIIFNIAESYIFIRKYGILHIKNNSTATKTQPKDNKLLGEIFLLDVLFEFSKNNSNKNIAISHLVNINSKYDLNNINNNFTRFYLKSIIEKMNNCSLISKLKRYQIKQIYKKFIKQFQPDTDK